MCRGCYEEYGEPTIDNDKVRRAADLIAKIYEAPGGGAGGNCHIVVDDWNLEDHNVEFCLGEVAHKLAGFGDREDKCDPDTLRIEDEFLRLFIAMSEPERASALGLHDQYWSVEAVGIERGFPRRDDNGNI